LDIHSQVWEVWEEFEKFAAVFQEPQHVLLASTTAGILDQLRNWCLLPESMTPFAVRLPFPFFPMYTCNITLANATLFHHIYIAWTNVWGVCYTSADCCDGSDEYEKRVNCANTCGGAIKEPRENLKEGLSQSASLDTSDDSEDILHHQQKKFGEDLVSKLKGRLLLFSVGPLPMHAKTLHYFMITMLFTLWTSRCFIHEAWSQV
jgi:hypothetical protein